MFYKETGMERLSNLLIGLQGVTGRRRGLNHKTAS